MARNHVSLLPSFLPPLFSLLAVIFSALTLSSKDWAIRHQYAATTVITTQFKPIYTQYRSPFQICNVIADNVTLPLEANITIATGTSVDNTTFTDWASTDDSSSDDTVFDDTPADTTSVDDVPAEDGGKDEWGGSDKPLPSPDNVTQTYTEICQKFKPSGRGKTSCELPAYLGRFGPEDLSIGDRRQCQQVHYAGNFGILSTTFLSLALVCSIASLALAFMTNSKSASSQKASVHHHEVHHASGNEEELDGKTTSTEERIVEHHSQPKSKPSSIAPYFNLVLLISLSIGIASALIAQFYGILAFVQSAPNNGDFIISSGDAGHHDPWIQGRALSTFLTLAWGFAVLAAGAAGAIWRVPRFTRV